VVKHLAYKINFTCTVKHTKKQSTPIESRRWKKSRISYWRSWIFWTPQMADGQ